MSKNLVTTGDQFARKGSPAWADWQRSRMRVALKDVNFEARRITDVIREMCSSDPPAWHIMTTEEGEGFRAFEQFVTTPIPNGLGFPDYPKFKAMALSERHLMGEREYDLLTAAPAMSREEAGKQKGQPLSGQPSAPRTKIVQLRAINRAPGLIRELYVAGLIDAKLAERLGPDPKAPADRRARARAAFKAVQRVKRSGDDAAYRKAVNAAVIAALGARARPTPLERAQKLCAKMTPADRAALAAWLKQQR